MAAAGGLRAVLGVEIALLASRARLRVVDPARPNLKQDWLEAVNKLCNAKRGGMGFALVLHQVTRVYDPDLFSGTTDDYVVK